PLLPEIPPLHREGPLTLPQVILQWHPSSIFAAQRVLARTLWCVVLTRTAVQLWRGINKELRSRADLPWHLAAVVNLKGFDQRMTRHVDHMALQRKELVA